MRYKGTMLAVVLGTTALTSFSAHAVQLAVGTCKPALTSFTTIGAAVAAAAPGAAILVCPGTYPEQVTIAKNLTLQGVSDGANAGQPAIVAPPGGIVTNATSLASGNPIAAQIFVQNAAKVTISALTVDGSNSQINGCAPDLMGILYQNASGVISNNAVLNESLGGGLTGCQSGLGIFVQSSSGGAGSVVSILNNHVENYEKNGITGNEPGTTVKIIGNTVIGAGPTSGAAENSIQIGFGAKGVVSKNVVGDDVWAPDVFGDTGNAAAGILIYAGAGVKVTGNIVSNTQYGISISGDNNGDGDGATVSSNKVTTTHLYDAVDICGAGNATVSTNTINGSDESAVHLDSACGGPSTGNTVANNIVNLACAGILEGAGSSGSNTTNTFVNVTSFVVTASDTCQPVAPRRGARLRPAGFRP